MLSICVVVFSVLTIAWSEEDLRFPKRFQFGVASSSYQIEGAWNISDKGESIWDRFTHKKSQEEQVNGDVACDSYNLWKRDVEMLEDLGVNFYRFSISWSRILPKGFSNHISTEGIQYYSDLIDALLEKGIEPVVTLYHWDLPQKLQDLGGWANPLVSDWFADYARIVYSNYGDRVNTWITVNEPIVLCELAYRLGSVAPGIISPEVGTFLCNKHVLLAHAKAWRVYDEEFRAKYHGRVSLINFVMWFQPSTVEDEDLAELAQQFLIGLYSHPIFAKDGGWPPAVEKVIADESKKLGYPRSNLPVLSKKEAELIRGTYDFYALNYYTSRVIRKANSSEVLKPWPIGDAPQLNAKLDKDPSWQKSAYSLYPIYPEGIRKQLTWLKKEYGDMPFIIGENGVSNNRDLYDQNRIEFFRDHLKQILLAIKEDGVNVTAFTAWSLMDSFEWMNGYTNKFGLYAVDFTSPGRERTPRASAFYYSSVVKNQSLDVPEDIVTLYANTTKTSKGYNYLYIIGGILLAVALISLTVYQVKRRRTPALSNDTYIGIRTEESGAGM